MVQYQVKSEHAEENVGYIKKVFEELKLNSPEGLRYASFILNDGLSFVHFASIETEDGKNPLSENEAFKKFQERIKDRCEQPPVAFDLNDVGSYRIFGG